MKRVLALALLLSALFFPASARAAEASPWYAQDAAYVLRHHLMACNDRGFDPDGAVDRTVLRASLENLAGKPLEDGLFDALPAEAALTRAQAAPLICRVLGEDGLEPAEALAWMTEQALLKGGGGGVACDTPLTRAQLAVLLRRCDTLGSWIPFRFAGKEEGAALLLDNQAYFDSFHRQDLAYRLERQDGTMEEYYDLCRRSVLDFTQEQKAMIERSMRALELRLAELGATLPIREEIVFVCTTGEEEHASGYTHRSEIYLNSHILSTIDRPNKPDYCCELINHELFHVLSRNDPAFRAAAYALIGFQIAEQPIRFSDHIRELIYANPDVERFDDYALFTVKGEKKPCTLISYPGRPFEEAGQRYYAHMRTGVVPLDAPSTVYSIDEVPDFWTVMGRNTDYVIAAEECMADNFSYALTYGAETGPDGKPYPNPEIIRGILDLITQ